MCVLLPSSGERFSVPTCQVAPLGLLSIQLKQELGVEGLCWWGLEALGSWVSHAGSLLPGVDYSGTGLDLLAPGLHPMETWRHMASVLDRLGVCL